VDALQEYSWRDVTRFSLSSLAAHGNQLTPDTSKVLLQEVSIRLAAQHKTLQALVDSLDHEQQSETSSEMPSISGSDGDQPHRKIIKATNGPVGMYKHPLQQLQYSISNKQLLGQALKNSQKALNGLQRLHQDTFDLTHHLLHQSHVYERFSKADQHLIFATMEQVRSRHASTVEVLADVVIGLQQTSSERRLSVPLVHSFLRGGCRCNSCVITPSVYPKESRVVV
jgi:hypothetical protein